MADRVIPARPAPRIAALVLAAGRASRMGSNKLLIPLDGRSMVTHAVDAVLAAVPERVLVVTGHEGAAVRGALGDRPVRYIDNPHHAAGLSSSLKAGLAALPETIDGVLVCLGDMPGITANIITQVIAAFDPLQGAEIVVPVCVGRRGNPVLWGQRLLPELMAITGDRGGRALFERYRHRLVELALDEPGVLLDLDTPADLAAFRGAPG
jgi:molybdenum cofactor cytidylyltransferase